MSTSFLINLGLFGLFCGAFLSATLLPFPSEALVLGVYALNKKFWLILIIATLGNFLGALTNYYIGFKSNSQKLIKRFKLNDEKINAWELKLKKYGYWLGLISWLPIIGDPMIAVLGFFKVRLFPLTILMFLGKFIRYFVLLYVFKEMV